MRSVSPVPAFLVVLFISAISAVALGASVAAAGEAHPHGAEKIRNTCNTPIPGDLPAELTDYLRAGGKTVTSLPTVSCIAVLYKKVYRGTLDRVFAFRPAKVHGYFLTAKFGLGDPPGRSIYHFGSTPVTLARWIPGRRALIRRWASDAPGFRVKKGAPMTLRRIEPRPDGTSNVQTIRVLRVFPIRRKGEVVDRLFLLIDDWGKWRDPKDHELRWFLYSERANAVVHRSLILSIKGYPLGKTWLRDVVRIIYFKGEQTDLTIGADELREVMAFTHDFDVKKY